MSASYSLNGMAAKVDITRAIVEVFPDGWHVDIVVILPGATAAVRLTRPDGTRYSKVLDYRGVVITGSYSWWKSTLAAMILK
jgi:hypothetical protein